LLGQLCTVHGVRSNTILLSYTVVGSAHTGLMIHLNYGLALSRHKNSTVSMPFESYKTEERKLTGAGIFGQRHLILIGFWELDWLKHR
jgi:hypothetical protein